ncbi:MAG: hypothetical protein LBH16_07170 [Treponema sp.]|jgi:hypothetical protein|nr:hypothetical protein [Treponema sp.]
MKKLIFLALTVLIAFCLPAAGCKNSKIDSVDREDLFTLDIGPMDDQIALYQVEGDRGIKRTGFTMRDGLFYISDGNSGKIVRYNSYGNLLFMIYNEETNPLPISLKANISGGEQATRWAYTYPLSQPGWIAVDARKHIFAEDKLPPQMHRHDSDNRALLDGIILHFDQDGRFIDYIGREGIGGSPFPRIVGLSTSVRDELAVICRIPDGWDVYWYNSSGMLLYLVKISTGAIPAIPDWPEALAVIDSIAAAPDARQIYLKVDYSHYTYDESTNTRTGSEPVNSVIWTLNVEDGVYSSFVEIPLYELAASGRAASVKVFYSLLGVMRTGKALFYFPVETGYAILFIDTHSREQRRGNIAFTNEELQYNDFFLSNEGILCAMLADNYRIKFVWWQTDKLIEKAE